MAEQFTFFWSGPFSQWHPSPFTLEGLPYGCAEQWMMAEKARLFGDSETAALIMANADPATQKRLGRAVRGFDNAVWLAKAPEIVLKGSLAKYGQNPDLKAILLATAGTTLVEASPHDRLWGIGLTATDPRAADRATWLGKNWLGAVLTRVRDHLLRS